MFRLAVSALLLVPLLACPSLPDDPIEGDACETAADCEDGQAACVPPTSDTWARSPCGACLTEEDECSTDTDCGAGFACRPEGPCGCGQVTLICVTGCSDDADCLSGQTCNGDAHCVATTCAADADCPDNFSCTGGACARRACTDSSVCEGECVSGACHDELGTCVEPVAVP